ncbi:MAG: hypothetical protein ACREKL_07750, partial [Chthoniobacterales bacterium]
MSLRLNPCLAAVFLCLTGGLCRAAPDAHALVDEILANPGHFQQACSFFAIMDGQEMPLPVNGVLARGEHRISTENFARLR